MTFPGKEIERSHVAIKRGRLQIGTALVNTGLKGADLEAERQRMDVMGEWMSGANRQNIVRFHSSRDRWLEWEKIAKPFQIPPPDFTEWTITGARASGRTRAAAEYFAAIAYEKDFYLGIFAPSEQWTRGSQYKFLFDACQPNIWRERDGNKIEFTNGGKAIICHFMRGNEVSGIKFTHLWVEGLRECPDHRREIVERDIRFLVSRGVKVVNSNL